MTPDETDIATLYENIGITKPCWIRYSDIQKMLESGLLLLSRQIHEAQMADLAKARSDYQFMVERAADQKLDGYRELGTRAAAAEERADRAEAKVRQLEADIERLQHTCEVACKMLEETQEEMSKRYTAEWKVLGLQEDLGNERTQHASLREAILHYANNLISMEDSAMTDSIGRDMLEKFT